MEEFSNHGYNTLGYDKSKAMITYYKQRLRKNINSTNKAKFIVGDMKNLIFNKKYDAAIICINSLGYLINNDDIISHFRAMSQSLKKEGIYIVEISCKCNDIANEKTIDDIWFVKEENVELEVNWIIKNYEIEHRIRNIDFRMIIKENGTQFIIEESHRLRLWIFEEFKEFIFRGGFDLINIYNQKYEPIQQDFTIIGELGALYFILKNKK